jgi:sphinganine C4-monooxygenase
MANNTSEALLDILQPRPQLITGISDNTLSLIVPVVTHWLTAAIYETFERFGLFQKYRIHTSDEELAKNTVSRLECLRGVLLVQVR